MDIANNAARSKKPRLISSNARKPEPTWMLAASTLEFTEYTTSRAYWETTIVGQTTKRGAKY